MHGSDALPANIGRILVSRGDISRRVAELGEQIFADLGGEPVTLAAPMTGSLIFVSDLIRRLPVMMRIHLSQISSYEGTSTRGGPLKVRWPLPEDLADQRVLIVDDILDSGRTLNRAVQDVKLAGAVEVRTCVLVAKPPNCRAENGLARADYTGFEIPDEFIVGYGMDFDDYYRNLPDIAVLKGVR